MNTRFRGLRRRDIAVIPALTFAVGLPFFWVQYALFGPSDRLLSFFTSRFRFNADTLTAAMMAVYLLLFGLMCLAAHFLLRRFLR